MLRSLTATQKLQHNFSGMDPSIAKPWAVKQPDALCFLQERAVGFPGLEDAALYHGFQERSGVRKGYPLHPAFGYYKHTEPLLVGLGVVNHIAALGMCA